MKKLKIKVLPRSRKLVGIDIGGTLAKFAIYMPKKGKK